MLLLMGFGPPAAVGVRLPYHSWGTFVSLGGFEATGLHWKVLEVWTGTFLS